MLAASAAFPMQELRQAQRVHETFTELSIGEAGPRQVLEAVQRLAGAAVVLEVAAPVAPPCLNQETGRGHGGGERLAGR
jgi:hypothetical protein